MFGWLVTWAVKESQREESAESKGFIFTFPREGKGSCGGMHQHQPWGVGWGCELLLGDGGGCRAGCFSWSCVGRSVFRCHLWVLGAVVGCGLGCPVSWVPQSLCLQGASSNFLVLRIKAYKKNQGQSCLMGSSQLWERGPENVTFECGLEKNHLNQDGMEMGEVRKSFLENLVPFFFK